MEYFELKKIKKIGFLLSIHITDIELPQHDKKVKLFFLLRRSNITIKFK